MTFETACGSVIGTAHLRAGRNGQDGWAIEHDDAGRTVMVVTDGCGSAPHSEVGAKLGARIVAREILTQEWTRVAGAIGERLSSIDLDVNDYLLFTIVGALITPEEVLVFHAGDGLFAINGEVHRLGPYDSNAPPYLAYSLVNGVEPELTIAYRGPAAEVDSILIATDGAEPLVATGELAEFVRVSHNPDAIRRRLFLLTRPNHARLDDDTTIALARRVGVTPSFLPLGAKDGNRNVG